MGSLLAQAGAPVNDICYPFKAYDSSTRGGAGGQATDMEIHKRDYESQRTTYQYICETQL